MGRKVVIFILKVYLQVLTPTTRKVLLSLMITPSDIIFSYLTISDLNAVYLKKSIYLLGLLVHSNIPFVLNNVFLIFTLSGYLSF